jgi:hypothetical protein
MYQKINILTILLLSILLTSCTSEEEEFNYGASISNLSDVTLNVKGYNGALNQLAYDFDLESMNSGGNVNYSSPSFGGYISGADSLIFTFPNSKGYICVVRNIGNSDIVDQFCFSNKSPFDSMSFQDLGNNTFLFEITQDDFDNAFELP